MNVRPLCLLHLSQGERSDRIDRCDLGEGMRPIDGPYPLTPTLSPWEWGSTEVAEIVFSFNGQLNHSASGGSRQ
jgi:hypothetical protein